MPYPALPPKPPLVVQVPVFSEAPPPSIPSPVAIPPESSIPEAAGDSFSRIQPLAASTPAVSAVVPRRLIASSLIANSLTPRASSLGAPLQAVETIAVPETAPEAPRTAPGISPETASENIESVQQLAPDPPYPPSSLLTVDFSEFKLPELGRARLGQLSARSRAELNRLAPDRLAAAQLAQATAPSPPTPNSQIPNLQEVVPLPAQPPSLQSPGVEAPQSTPSPLPSSPLPSTPTNSLPLSPIGTGEAVELRADRQEFDLFPQVFIGEGNATLLFRGAVLQSDRVQVNLPNRIAVAEGNVILTRGQQRLQGDRAEYNLVQGSGSLEGARGDLFLPSAEQDFAPTLATDISPELVPTRTVGNQVEANQPFQVTPGTPGFNLGINTGGRPGQRSQPGALRRLRFESDQLDFTSAGGLATNVRITNDPFSPPELELRADRVTLTRLSPTQSEIRATRPRLVFDQGFSLPLLRNRILLDSRDRNPGLVQFGFDERDKDGFFLQGNFEVLNRRALNISVTPQVLVQRAIDQGLSASAFGLETRIDAQLSPTTTLFGRVQLNSLDFSDFADTTRARVQVRQRAFANHTLNLDYVYRDRLFNGSLGFRNVQSSLGLVLTSPAWRLGNTGINFSYQAGVQFINAETDFPELLPAGVNQARVDLTRYQASAALNRFFPLWSGQPLPATPTEGLRYTPTAIVPYVGVSLGARGVFSGYSSGDSQSSLTGTINLVGQFGHFSRPVFDYTAFILGYSADALSGQSPFLFDRDADRQVLTLGIMQQVYGGLRVGVQLQRNIETGEEIDTIYSLEYNRRTYALSLSYSPKREAATINFRLSDFNWSGDPGSFSGIGADSVSGGVRRPGR